MLGLFWWLLSLFGVAYVIPIPLVLSIVIGWVVYALQKPGRRDDEARQQATLIAVVFFVVLTLIGCWLFYLSNPDPIFL